MTAPMTPERRAEIERTVRLVMIEHAPYTLTAAALCDCLAEIDRLHRLVTDMKQRDADLTADAASWREQ